MDRTPPRANLDLPDTSLDYAPPTRRSFFTSVLSAISWVLTTIPVYIWGLIFVIYFLVNVVSGTSSTVFVTGVMVFGSILVFFLMLNQYRPVPGLRS